MLNAGDKRHGDPQRGLRPQPRRKAQIFLRVPPRAVSLGERSENALMRLKMRKATERFLALDPSYRLAADGEKSATAAVRTTVPQRRRDSASACATRATGGAGGSTARIPAVPPPTWRAAVGGGAVGKRSHAGHLPRGRMTHHLLPPHSSGTAAARTLGQSRAAD